MWAFLLGVVGALIGAGVAEEEGFFFGTSLGVVLGLVIGARGRIGELGKQLHDLTIELRRLQLSIEAAQRTIQTLRTDLAELRARPQVQVAEGASVPTTSAASPPPPIATEATAEQADVDNTIKDESAVAVAEPRADAATVSPATITASVTTPARAIAPSATPASPTPPQKAPEPIAWEPPRPDPILQAMSAARAWLFGGNTVVRVGTLVLLVGVVLLLKYAADHALFPIEARLSGAALIAIGLVGFGFRQRHARPGFGLTLQGGGVAAVYLVVFFAYRTYALVPSGFAFAAFAIVAAASATLAVVQRSQSLAFIGTLGGFAAPVLASSGSGNHVALFSYYLLLIVMVASIAWFRAWRALNLLAFTCTYGIATAWGALKYRSEHFASTEPFVIAYFLLFVAIAVLFSLRGRQPARVEDSGDAAGRWRGAGVVNGSLVFGTPLVTLLAQARLVEGKELGMALSTAALGLFYVTLGTVLWKRHRETVRNLVESFIALGAAFGTLAIPFALDNALTTAMAWALEGAGAYWAGTRQKRTLPKLAGLALQGLAFAALAKRADSVFDVIARHDSVPFANVSFLSCITLTLSAFLIAITAYKDRQARGETPRGATQLLALWGYVIWAFACGLEIDAHVEPSNALGALLFGAAITAWTLTLIARAARWSTARLLALLLLPEAGVLLLIAAADSAVLDGIAVGAWPVVIVSAFLLVDRARHDAAASKLLFAPAWWLAAAVPALGLPEVVGRIEGMGDAWAFAVGGSAAALLFVGVKLTQRALGPFAHERDMHLLGGGGPISGALLLFCLSASVLQRGDTYPLPYLPLLNVIDLAHALCLLAVLVWHRQRLLHVDPTSESFRERTHLMRVAVSGLCFVWLNAIIARSVHHFASVPFDFDSLWRSVVMQSALSIAWTLLALLTMLWATRKGLRTVWIIAAVLLGVVVLKLFTIDLAKLSTLLKIGTFLVVGMLLMAIGYFSPVPPAAVSTPDKEPA